jgi:hypothetical protein
MKRIKSALITQKKLIGLLVSVSLTTTFVTTPLMAQGFKPDKAISSSTITTPIENTLGLLSELNHTQPFYHPKRAHIKITAPIKTSSPATTPIPSITPAPSTDRNDELPIQTQNPEKINTRIFCDTVDLTTDYPSNSASFKVYLVDNLDNPIVGKTVSWNWNSDLDGKTETKVSAVTDSEGTAVFTITKEFDPDNTYVEWIEVINLYFDGDDIYNASFNQHRVIVSNNGLHAE